MKPIAAIPLIFIALMVAGKGDADAASKTHHRSRAVPEYGPLEGRSAVRDPDRFYPEEIEGGVSGNLPFNNQLRKLSDPLNANGGGG